MEQVRRNTMTTNTAPLADVRDEKRFASEYSERTERVELEDISKSLLTHGDALDFTYRTGPGSTRTIRCHHGRGPASYNEVPEGYYAFYHNGDKYGYSIEDRRIKSLNQGGTDVTVATENDILRVERVKYTERAVVEGAVGKDVQATVYYRSPASDRMQTMTIGVTYLEGRRSASEITGEADDGTRVKVLTRWERTIKVSVRGGYRTIGRVARVEFPKGHRFSVTVEGLGDDRAESKAESMERKLAKVFRHDDVDIDVTHEGRLEWED